ncbi:kinase-like domain-containing protein [Nemania sp. FL0916]|nr:kinase-like domain-containing protein [Nemania sp. FL0916]
MVSPTVEGNSQEFGITVSTTFLEQRLESELAKNAQTQADNSTTIESTCQEPEDQATVQAPEPCSESPDPATLTESELEQRFGSTADRVVGLLAHGQLSTPEGRESLPQARTPISQFGTQHIRCRILIQPGDPTTFEGLPNHYKYITCGVIPSTTDRAMSEDHMVRCIPVTQGREDIKYTICRPFHIEFHYDTRDDSISITTQQPNHIFIIRELIDKASNRIEHREYVFSSGSTATGVDPGMWAVYKDASSIPFLQFRLYPRAYSLEVLATKKPLTLAGGKRSRPAPRNSAILSGFSSASSARLSSDLTVIEKINAPSSLDKGGLMRMMENGVEEYQLRRLGLLIHQTRNSTVFRAKITAHPEEDVIVKIIESDDVVVRGNVWKQEYDLLRQLQSDKIVPLIGGDARIGALYLKWIDAFDLARGGWRDKRNYFTGSEQVALTILRDMAEALCDLQDYEIVHHDIKPCNILHEKGNTVLIDFGIATQPRSHPQHGGTPWYLPPEIMSAGHSGGQRGPPEDIWALGVVMLYLLKIIPLPEMGPPRPWSIKGAGQPGSSAHQTMTEWLDRIKKMKTKLDPSEPVHRVVKEMLVIRPALRITPREILEALAEN